MIDILTIFIGLGHCVSGGHAMYSRPMPTSRAASQDDDVQVAGRSPEHDTPPRPLLHSVVELALGLAYLAVGCAKAFGG